jgi:hypothetical protein
MTKFLTLAVLIASFVAAGGFASGAASAPVSYYVDFDAGSDDADGQSPATPWKHAPGDPNATARPHAVALQPGDKVIFKGGVAYRGSIIVPASGAPGAPIIYEGSGWGRAKAILTGLDRAEADFAPYAQDPKLSAARIAVLVKPWSVVTIDGRRSFLSNDPPSRDPFLLDENLTGFSLPNELKGANPNWTFVNPELVQRLSSFPPDTVPNLVARVFGSFNWMFALQVAGLDPAADAIALKGGYTPWDPKHEQGYHLLNHPSFISGRDQFAIESDQQLVACRPAFTRSRRRPASSASRSTDGRTSRSTASSSPATPAAYRKAAEARGSRACTARTSR